ncbi:type I polyketide synthase [Nocardia sp. NPDC059195]|uniref:type I polyketide synthase n=1 Tax=Nocardia sp. NPDC059195 TaxID=3346765 RepID=UPI0036857C66
MNPSTSVPASSTNSDAVAVVGTACRLPGAANPTEFWALLRDGRSGLSTVPEGRGLVTPPRGGFIDGVDEFDPGFFEISPREAAALDPQQRVTLELAWEAVEDAGWGPADLAGENVGVFVGVASDDYSTLRHKNGAGTDRHTLTGTSRAVLANRLSYFFGFRGPSFAVDSGQSSSLVAVHLACESIKRGESSIAIAGGVNLILTDESTIGAEQFGALSPHGECFTFDARADGYVRGEGGGLVLLKSLKAALADGDVIHAVIEGSAINNDGFSHTLTTPDRGAQEAVIVAAHRQAGVGTQDIDFVELHGTGTRVGDPIEAAALGAVFGPERTRNNPLRVGSVKTNIGHLEAAAGVSGLIKAILAVRHGELPPSLNYVSANPNIDLVGTHLAVQTTLHRFDSGHRPRGGVSSFGMGGTNCHVVLSGPPLPPSTNDFVEPSIRRDSDEALVFPVSAKTPDAIAGQAARLLEMVRSDRSATLSDISRSLISTRTVFSHRTTLIADDRENLVAQLSELATSDAVHRTASERSGVAFLFSGQGAQYPGMGADLYRRFPAFSDTIDAVTAEFDRYLDIPLTEVLFGESMDIDETVYTQPALFVFEVALFRLLEQWGVRPSAVAGHSIGELAAAYVAGVFSLPDAVRLVAARGRLLQELPRDGAMVAIAATQEEAAADLVGRTADVSIAAVNGPTAVVISGDAVAVDEVAALFRGRGRKTKRLTVSHAFHSPRVDAVLDEFRLVAETVTYHAPRLTLIAGVTGTVVDSTTVPDAEYWTRHIRDAVLFANTVDTLSGLGIDTFVEVGPDATLTALTRPIIGDTGEAFALARRGRNGPQTLLAGLGQAFDAGLGVDWSSVPGDSEARIVPLPTYAFARRRYWLDTVLGRDPVVETTPPATTERTTDVPTQAVASAQPRATDRRRTLLSSVRREAAVVLGHRSSHEIVPSSTFQELGFDSLAGVELRNRLRSALGVELPDTVVFDHPTPTVLAAYLSDLLGAVDGSVGDDRTHPGPAIATDDPIAIIGISCRYPGADSPEELWSLLSDERDALSTFPTDRGWDLDALARAGSPEGSATENGGFLRDAAGFDSNFFKISPVEALAMDPQQRLLLETSWEAFEHARIDPESLRGSTTGVFVGGGPVDYGTRLDSPADGLEGHRLTGGSPSILSGRIAYSYGFEGPAVTVDTACSSSLVSLHLAVRSLRSGESTLALAGGVTLMPTPGMFLEFSRQGGLSVDGRCKSFSSAADGTGWSEGVGVLLLERLSDARRLGHRVLAVVRGSAINQDGASNGLTAPSGPAQQRVIRAALADAGLGVGDVDVVEAHGTGTRLGDPIEAGALLATYGRGREVGRPLWLGSVKSNIGHTQAAAGVAGVITMVMAMERGVLPRTLHIDEPSSHVDWSVGAVELLTSAREWGGGSRVRRAGVSSFGMSGTNAHVVLEEAPSTHDTTPVAVSGSGTGGLVGTGSMVPLVVSGRGSGALAGQASRVAGFVESLGEGEDVVDVGWSLVSSRSTLENRAVVVADGRDGAVAGLRALATGEPAVGVVSGVARVDAEVVFVFPGQGSQWWGMGRELLESSAVFASAIRTCEQALAPYVDWSRSQVLRGEGSEVDFERVDVVQPVLFAVMVGLARVWESVGVRPAAVVGHSQGEIAAAHVAGALSLEDAVRVVALRSRALREIEGLGAMASISLGRGEVEQLSAPWADVVSVAVVNGPAATVISGDRGAVERVLELAEARGARVRWLPVSYASHSRQVEVLGERLLSDLESIEPVSSSVAFHSTLTGGVFDTAGLDARYWFDNLRNTVEFEKTVDELVTSGFGAFVEVSPHPVLLSSLTDIIDSGASDAVAVGTLARDEGGIRQLFGSFAEAYVRGVAVNWDAVFDGSGARTVSLPTYAFDRTRYWLTSTSQATGAAESALVDVPEAKTEQSAFRAQLDPLTDSEQHRHALRLVLRHVSAVLGYGTDQEIDPAVSFRDLGFSSLTAVRLRNQLVSTTGVALPTAVLYDFPSPHVLAKHLRDEALGIDSVGIAGDTHVAAGPRGDEDDPVVIIAMACRYPGADSPEELWNLVDREETVQSPFPTDRGWDLDRLYDPDKVRPSTSYTRFGGFLGTAGDFDPAAFGISPREALAMDPQQRLLLEATWEVFERAGIPVKDLEGNSTGVFVGTMGQEYGARMHEAPREVEGFLMTGVSTSVTSGRLAYTFGLNGPAVTVDTACSSSLVSLHLAAQALRSGQCSQALAAGATIMSNPGTFIEFSRQGGLSVDGRCKSFSSAADGFGPSEGVGVLLLERLSDARRLGHRVLAVVRGSAINQDGASNGLTAPSGPAQQRVIRAALADAGLGVGDVDVVEAHGTGTRLGDPIEAGALLATYGRGREVGRPLWLGSVKSNIGHTQAAAGVAGVIKMVMAMERGVLPRTLHIDEPSSHVDWSVGDVELLTSAREWGGGSRVRRAGVSSFGMSGTNAHVVLEEAPSTHDTTPVAVSGSGTGGLVGTGSMVPLVVSGRGSGALAGQASRVAGFVESLGEGEDVVDVGWSLVSSRSTLENRAVVVADGRDGAVAGLRALATGEPAVGVVSGVARVDAEVVFVFPGQGSQWWGMGRELLESSAVFASAIRTCEQALAPYVDWSLSQVLRGEGSEVDFERVDVVQPVLFAVMVGLARVWESVGVRPAAVVGHSQGEIAAAHVAGALSLEDAVRVVALRSRALREIEGLGAMASISLGRGEVEQLSAPWADVVSVAVVNGPAATVISGDRGAVERVLELAEARGARVRWLPVSYASHSRQVEVLGERLLTDLETIEPISSPVAFHSTLTGGVFDTAGLDARYWFHNLRNTVEFEHTVRSIAEGARRVFLEVSSHPVLVSAIGEVLEEIHGNTEQPVVGTLRRDDGGVGRVLTSAAELFVHGVAVDWDAVFDGSGARAVSLPTYAFDRTRYWLTSTPSGAASLAGVGLTDVEHPLVSAVVGLAGTDGRVYSGRLSPSVQPWLDDHLIGEDMAVPTGALVELALRVGQDVGSPTVENLEFIQPLYLAETAATLIQVAVDDAVDGGRTVLIHSRRDAEDAEWTLNAEGRLSDRAAVADRGSSPWPPADASSVDVGDIFTRLALTEVSYGPTYQVLGEVWRSEGEYFADLRLDDGQERDVARFALHPALLESAVQIALLATDPSRDGTPASAASWSGVEVHALGASSLRLRVTPTSEGAFAVRFEDDSSRLVARADALTVRSIPARPVTSSDLHDALLRLDWVEVTTEAVDEPARWAVIGEDVPEVPDARLFDDVSELAAAVEAGDRIDAVVLSCVEEPQTAESTVARVYSSVNRVLEFLGEWVSEERVTSIPLVVLTRGAVAPSGEDVTDLAGASIWGLTRSAQSEAPDRIWLVDADSTTAEQLSTLVRLDEPQLMIRAGSVLVPRLARAAKSSSQPRSTPQWNLDGTVLITGGTGTLGTFVTRHLIEVHGIRHLLLTSRRGPEAEGAAELVALGAELGAEVRIAACDTADRATLEELLRSISDDHPLTGVVHAAGTHAPGLLSDITPEMVETVLRPKVDAAWHLHELTRDLDLAAFVVFSSIAAVFGGPGQANYAAANVFMEALAQHRAANGLKATSLAWGLWAELTGITSQLQEVDLGRIARDGFRPMPTEQGLALFDAGLVSDDAVLTGTPLDLAPLRASGEFSSLLRGLIRTPGRRAVSAGSGSTDTGGGLGRRLQNLSSEEQRDLVLDLVLAEVAAVLGNTRERGHESADRPFQDFGFDSLTAVELRNRLRSATGVQVPTTLVFDHPTPKAVTEYLLSQLVTDDSLTELTVLVELEAMEARLSAFAVDADRRSVVAGHLSELSGRWRGDTGDAVDHDFSDLESATDDELFALLDTKQRD